MIFRLGIILLFLSSCGVGGGNSSDEVLAEINSPEIQNSSQQCTDFDGSTYSRTYRCEFKHKGIDRYYYIQLGHPEAVGQSSILFNLHGYGSNALAQMQYADFRDLAYSKDKNFILIHPQGAPLNTAIASSVSHWNSGAWTIGSPVDDIDFINTIIEFVSNKYNINDKRIYSTGMSNGGFMSYHLACNLSSKIAAIASVTGSMSKQTLESCNPNHPTSILQIHGTIDGSVPFDGNSVLGMEGIDDVINYWHVYNACNSEPLTKVEDYFVLGFAVEHQTFQNCLNGVQVELYKVEGMWHTWPSKERFGISATELVWDFINTYDIDGYIN
jgi:polyhydroxybutyrate depolymerase